MFIHNSVAYSSTLKELSNNTQIEVSQVAERAQDGGRGQNEKFYVFQLLKVR